MVIRDFEIISWDKLHSLSAVDWSLCYFCQKDEKFDLRKIKKVSGTLLKIFQMI